MILVHRAVLQQIFFVYNNKIYFAADDSNGSNTGGADLGKELWVTDGTDAGTSLVKDLRIGSASSSPSSFFEYKGNHVLLSSGWYHYW